MKKIYRAVYISDVHLIFLDELRESGITNIFGARPYLMREFPFLNEKQASKILVYWMKTFGRKRR